MSLKNHIEAGRKSPIGLFFLQRFPKTASITIEVNKQLRTASTLLPTDQSLPNWVYGMLGRAIDYRICYSFEMRPHTTLTAWEAVPLLAFRPLQSEDDMPLPESEFTDLLFSQLSGIGFNFDPLHGAAQGPYTWKLLEAFFHSLDTTLTTIQPVQRQLSLEEERVLARYCFVLSLFEEAARAGQNYLGRNGILLTPAPRQSVDELLAIPKDAWIDDLCAMSRLFYERCHLYLTHPHVLNPQFVGGNDVGGADADLIVDRCLVELKASIRPKLDPAWLRQLIGYLLLDYDDRYRFTHVGIYMVRQGMTFRWTVKDFLYQLTGDEHVSLNTLRQEFQHIKK